MLVYCDVYDCKHNEDGMCENEWPIGEEAIRISEHHFGIPFCSDFENAEEGE